MGKLNTRVDDVRSVELDNAFYVEDGKWIESLTVSSTGDFDPEAVIGNISGASLFHTREIPTGPTDVTVRRLMLLATESYPFILETVLRREAIPNRIVLQEGRVDVVLTVRNWEDFRSLADDLKEALGVFDLKGMQEIDNPGEPLDSGRLTEVLVTKLTDEQLSVLETAYRMGYFDVPRDASAQDVAEELDISQSTFSERLRTAERNLLQLIYGASD